MEQVIDSYPQLEQGSYADIAQLDITQVDHEIMSSSLAAGGQRSARSTGRTSYVCTPRFASMFGVRVMRQISSWASWG